VALKFLPVQWTSDENRLARFRNEVRIARQISHPNVCRVYDIGEVKGSTYLSMEYVDGEDLASLLRRIGRLPPDKALELARQLCAGLAAAHDKGVVHRDLKPGNIMLDGQGQLRITDFGLAGVAGEVTDIRSGTPAYMAPEQRSGREVTARSDIYALGVVLHEVFTGKSPSADSTHPDLAPEVDRVIRRCLAEDPAKRPTSALQVAAALPGGDPLAAALAAGETPSPEMVAAAGDTEGLRPLVAWACLAGIIVSVVAVILMSAQTMLYRRVPLETPPEVLAQRARDILQSAGYSERPVDTAMGFYDGKEFLRYIREHDRSRTRWDHLETGAFVFWYRGSPRPLAAHSFDPGAPILGSIWTDDPPLDVSGMTLLRLNPRGRLTQLVAVPPQVEKPSGAASSPDWTALFAAAGLDPSRWLPSQPMWAPPVNSDSRAAWTGSLAERPNVAIRIEAAASRGKPVYLRVDWPLDPSRTHAAVSADRRRTGILGDFHCFVAFGADRRRNACSKEPASGPGRSSWGFSAGSVCFRGLWCGRVLWPPSRPGLRRSRALHPALGLRVWFLLFPLDSIHCPGALCAPALARRAGLLEPPARGRRSGSNGGTRCACWLSGGGVWWCSCRTRVVYSLLARLCSATAIFGSAVGLSGRARDNF